MSRDLRSRVGGFEVKFRGLGVKRLGIVGFTGI